MTSDTDTIATDLYSGVAAAAELDELLTSSDFEGEVDTEALDAALDARIGARVLAKKLDLLIAALSAGCTDEATAGLRIEVRMIVEKLDGVTAASIA